MRQRKMMIRLNDGEYRKLRAAAAKASLSLATWARMSLMESSTPESKLLCAESSKNGKRPDGPTLLSLFSGPGGLDEGFRQAGFNTALALDLDEECVRTFNANHTSTSPIAYQRDVQKLSLADIDVLAGGPLAPVGVIGGPPCQSFSVSNVHQAETDPRRDLALAYAHLLANMNQRTPLSFFVFENVPGLMGTKHRERYLLFKRSFRKAGFELYERVLDASEYGVPQYRERVIIVGINRTVHPAAIWEWPPVEAIRKTVRDAIGNLPPPILNARAVDPKTIPLHPNHWCMVPKSKKFSTPGALKNGESWGRSFRTLSWDRPSWTVAYGNREVHIHPGGRRRLSIYEAMLLQSFPTHYVMTGNISAQSRLVSEAVPPRFAWHIASAIRRSLSI
jgi:DNA (cytosine-5)-methyltransferase 1